MALAIESISVSELVPDPVNANTHPDRNLDAIRGSLARFGQQKPIVVNGDNVVIAGNGTLVAARALGWETLDCVRTDLSGADLIAYGIADNKTAELAEWDYENLSSILRGLSDEGDTELLLATGFAEFEIEPLLLAEWKPPGVVEDENDIRPESEGGPETEDGRHAVGFTDEQWEIVGQAIRSIRTREAAEEITASRAVELICADYIAGAVQQ